MKKILLNDRFQKAKEENYKEALMNEQNRMFLIKFPYWMGIAADALWGARKAAKK